MIKRSRNERDICSKFITAGILKADSDLTTHIRKNVRFTKGRVIVRGKLVTRWLAMIAIALMSLSCARWIDPASDEQKAVIARAVLELRKGDAARAAHARELLTGLGPAGIPALTHLFRHPPDVIESRRWIKPRSQILAALIAISPGGPEAARKLGTDALEAMANGSVLDEPWLHAAAAQIEPWILERAEGATETEAACSVTTLRSPAAFALVLPRPGHLSKFWYCRAWEEMLVDSASDAGVDAVIKAAVEDQYWNDAIWVLVDARRTVRPVIVRKLAAYLRRERLTDQAAFRLLWALRRMGEDGREAIVAGGRRAAAELVRTYASGDDEAVGMLRAMGDDARTELSAYLSQVGDRDRFWAAKIALIGHLQLPDAASRLREFAVSQHIHERVAAAEGFGALGDAGHTAAVLHLMADSVREVRIAAANAIPLLGPPAFSAVLAAADHVGSDAGDQRIRRAGVCALLHFGDPGEQALRTRPSANDLEFCFRDDPRSDVARIVVSLAPDDLIARLIREGTGTRYQELLSVYPHLSGPHREEVARMLRASLSNPRGHQVGDAKLAGDLCIEDLAPDLAKGQVFPFPEGLRALRSLGDEAVRSAVLGRLAHENDPTIRAELQRILGERGDEAAAEIADHYFREQSPRRIAEKGLIRLSRIGITGFVTMLLLAIGSMSVGRRPMWFNAAAFVYGVFCYVLPTRFPEIDTLEGVGSTLLLGVSLCLAVGGLIAFALESRLPGIRGRMGDGLLRACVGFGAALSVHILLLILAFLSLAGLR